VDRDERLRRRFGDRHALITGGSAGIGAAVARAFLDAGGGGVTLVARDAGRLEETAGELRRAHPAATVRTLALDVADEPAVSLAIARELAEQGTDLVVTSAGVAHAARFLDTDPETFRRLTAVNHLGTVWTIRAAVPHLRGRDGAHVAVVASTAAIEGIYAYSAYAPTKAAVMSFAQVMRAELRTMGIGVTLLLPPNTDTEQLANEIEQLPDEMRAIHATSKVMSPERVAGELLDGIAAGRFEVLPGLDNRMTDRAHRIWRRPLRTVFDRMVARGLRKAPARGH
jgi:3-dehydrosphinganine reductase